MSEVKVTSMLCACVSCYPQSISLSFLKLFVSNIKFLLIISLQDVLAQSAFCCRSYTRALMYLELYLMISPDAVQKNLGFLQVTIQKCYIK